ncbi:MAG: DUF4998 domain-containing protein [Bacteroidota bacterium]|nr:DUF4998 domain-containing protein [Bacteroidota bacterium]
MKQTIKTLTLTALALVMLIGVFPSCDDMNDIQSEYADRDERVYLGKVDSLKAFPGFGRAKITWYITADPKIEQTVIYWNQRSDSLVKNVSRSSSGVMKDSIIIENLPEGSTFLEFRNKNSKGEYSLYTSVTATAWGGNFAKGLRARRLTTTIFNYQESEFALEFTPAAQGDSVVYSELYYTDNQGVKKSMRIEREVNDTVLTNFADGAEFHFRNIFFLPQGMDTVYGDYQAVKAPKAVFDKGKKIDFPGAPDSRYSVASNKLLYEWTQTGDLILYELGDDGSISVLETYAGLAPRGTYRDFFFYDDGKFIGANNNGRVHMFTIENYQLAYVYQGSNNYFARGFTHPAYLPARGFFYSVSAVGLVQSWFIQNNATWSNPSSITVANEFPYRAAVLFEYNTLVAIDNDGGLWSVPISSTGLFRGLSKIGSGWNRFPNIITLGKKLYAVDGNGDFYEFDFNATDNYWIVD